MFSSPHPHDAMRRLLKAAVGVPDKAGHLKAKPDGASGLRHGSFGSESAARNSSPLNDPPGKLRK